MLELKQLESWLWKAVCTVRGPIDTSRLRDYILPLIFLKRISDVSDDESEQLVKEDRNQEAAVRFYVPPEARWESIQCVTTGLGQYLNDVMQAVVRENPQLQGIIDTVDYNATIVGQRILDDERLVALIKALSYYRLGLKDVEPDILGQVYEYLLYKFASAEGKRGDEFYTPHCIVRLLVEMLEPWEGCIYDPCCGSARMLVQSDEFIKAHATSNGNSGCTHVQISVYGQELNYATWRLAKMNLAIRGIDGRIEQGDTFHNDRFPDLRADYILANPPFNMKEWGGELLREDRRWKFGVPPVRNANFAWVQHIIHHLAPTGYAGFVLANGSMSSNQAGEGEIRKNIIEADLVDCMVALPGQLFYSTRIPACLWFIARDKGGYGTRPYRDRRGQVLFIDARRMGRMVDRVHRELTDEDIRKIADTYHAWRRGGYEDIPGFCKSATLDEIRQHGYVLTPGRYVGAKVQEEDDEPFDQQMRRLVAQLREQQAEATRLDAAIARNLQELGFWENPQ